MTMKKGRAVSVSERGVYEHCTRLFLGRQIHGFWAFDRDDWAIQFLPDTPALPRTFEEMKVTLLSLDPDGCVWQTGRPSAPKPRVSRPQMEQFLLALLREGLTPRLRQDAERMLGPALIEVEDAA